MSQNWAVNSIADGCRIHLDPNDSKCAKSLWLTQNPLMVDKIATPVNLQLIDLMLSTAIRW
jgi:hypothetical protein